MLLDDLPAPTGYWILDALMWLAVSILGLLEVLRRMGWIDAVGNRNGRRKTVGNMEVRDWEEALRHELRDEMDAFMRRMSEYQQRTLDKLEDINLATRELAAIFRERNR